MLCGHLDTVGVEGMIDPFVPRLRRGRLFGRGAQDMKSGVAAMIAAAAVLAQRGRVGRCWSRPSSTRNTRAWRAKRWRAWPADAAIVTEPTGLAVAVGHKGFAWLERCARGPAAHGSRPAEGRDAILRMGRVLMALELLDRELAVAASRSRWSAPDRCTPRSFTAAAIEQLSGSGDSAAGAPHRCPANRNRSQLAEAGGHPPQR